MTYVYVIMMVCEWLDNEKAELYAVAETEEIAKRMIAQGYRLYPNAIDFEINKEEVVKDW
jgi:hypothetical protein